MAEALHELAGDPKHPGKLGDPGAGSAEKCAIVGVRRMNRNGKAGAGRFRGFDHPKKLAEHGLSTTSLWHEV